jgi:hypothetical protein
MTNETKPLTLEEAEMWRDGLCDANDFEPDSLPLRILAMLDTLATREAELLAARANLAKVTAERQAAEIRAERLRLALLHFTEPEYADTDAQQVAAEVLVATADDDARWFDENWERCVGGVEAQADQLAKERDELEAKLNGADQRANAYLRERDEARVKCDAARAETKHYVNMLGMTDKMRLSVETELAEAQARANRADQRANSYLTERDEARSGRDNWREACRKAEAERDAIPDAAAIARERNANRARCAQLTEALILVDGSHLHADGCTSQGPFEAVGDKCGECGADLKAARLYRAALDASDSGAWLAERETKVRDECRALHLEGVVMRLRDDPKAPRVFVVDEAIADRDARARAALAKPDAAENVARLAEKVRDCMAEFPSDPGAWSEWIDCLDIAIEKWRALASKPEGGGR